MLYHVQHHLNEGLEEKHQLFHLDHAVFVDVNVDEDLVDELVVERHVEVVALEERQQQARELLSVQRPAAIDVKLCEVAVEPLAQQVGVVVEGLEVSVELVELLVGEELAAYQPFRRVFQRPLKQVHQRLEKVLEIRVELGQIDLAIVVQIDVSEHSVDELLSERHIELHVLEEAHQEQP